MRTFIKLIALAMVLVTLPLAAAAEPDNVRVIVVLEDGPKPVPAVAREMAKAFGGQVGFVYQHALRGFTLEVPEPAVAGLARARGVAYVEEDVPVSAAQTGSQDLPTGIDRVDADRNPVTTPMDVDIAIIDTGVYIGTTPSGSARGHLDLNLVRVADCTGAMFYPLFGGCTGTNHQDENGHGTHVAGIAAAKDNDIGSVGTAPGARLWSVKVLDANGAGYAGNVLAAVDLITAKAAEIEVANMSLAFGQNVQSITDAVNNSIARGVVYVVAAGNSGVDGGSSSPGNIADAVTVSALADFDGKPGGLEVDLDKMCRPDVDDTLADFSNFGSIVDIAAPGVCIYSTHLNDGYTVYSGTSMATPFVTGAIARYIAETGASTTSRADVLAITNAVIGGGADQTSTCGFTGDPDAFPEPVLFLNSAPFGGDGTCEGDGPPVDEPPVASFTVDCTDLTCVFDASASTDDDGIVVYGWDFGDGSTATGVTASHDYGEAGTYAVTLTVTDTGGLTDTDTQDAPATDPPSNPPPSASFTVTCLESTCDFTDTSTDDGTITAWSWDFGDGYTSSDQNPGHTYTAGGTYTVTLTVTDDEGATDEASQTVDVNQPPTAAFTADCTGLACSFTDTSTDADGTIVAWDWDFGDGGDSTAQNPSHTYTAGGSYTVTLTVTDDDDAIGTATGSVTVTNLAPTASFTVDCTDLTCTFDAGGSTDDGGIVSYAWTFGDLTTGSGVTVTHTYATAGTRPVSLTVTDGLGSSDTVTQQVIVTDPAPIEMTANLAAGFYWDPPTATIQFYVASANGFVVGAQVAGEWIYEAKNGRPKTRAVAATSDLVGLLGPGMVEIVTTFGRNDTPKTFCVTDIVASGYRYTGGRVCTSTKWTP